MKKFLIFLLTFAIAALLVTACGTNSEEIVNNVGGNDETGYETDDKKNNNETVTEEMLTTDIQQQGEKYIFTLKNSSEKEIELTFSSSQEYEYMIRDSEGEHIYTYSMDKMFAMAIFMKNLAPGEELAFEVDLDVLSTLESGTYTLEIWSAALESEGLTSEMEIII